MALMEINWRPDRSQLRTFAILWLAAFTLLGFAVAWRTGLLTGTSAADASWRLRACQKLVSRRPHDLSL